MTIANIQANTDDLVQRNTSYDNHCCKSIEGVDGDGVADGLLSVVVVWIRIDLQSTED